MRPRSRRVFPAWPLSDWPLGCKRSRKKTARVTLSSSPGSCVIAAPPTLGRRSSAARSPLGLRSERVLERAGSERGHEENSSGVRDFGGVVQRYCGRCGKVSTCQRFGVWGACGGRMPMASRKIRYLGIRHLQQVRKTRNLGDRRALRFPRSPERRFDPVGAGRCGFLHSIGLEASFKRADDAVAWPLVVADLYIGGPLTVALGTRRGPW